MRHTTGPRSAHPASRLPTLVPPAAPHCTAKALSFFSLRTENGTAKLQQDPPLAAPSVPLPARRPGLGTAAQRCQRCRPGKDALPAAPARRRELPRAAPSPGSPAAAAWGKRSSTRARGKTELRDERSLSQQGSGAGCRARLRCPPRLAVRAPGGTGGGEGSDPVPCPALPGAALPARRIAGRFLLVEELGQAGRRRHPSAGAPAGGSAAGIALRPVGAAGGRGLAHGSGGDHAGRPLRRAGGAGHRAGGGREGRWPRTGPAGDRALSAAPPPNPPPPGWRRRDRSPAAEPALREGAATGRGRPAPRGAAVALGGPRGRSRQRPGKGPPPHPAPPGRRARPPPPSVGRTCRGTSGPAGSRAPGFYLRVLWASIAAEPRCGGCAARSAPEAFLQGFVLPPQGVCVSESVALGTTRSSLPRVRRDAGIGDLLSKFTFVRERSGAGGVGVSLRSGQSRLRGYKIPPPVTGKRDSRLTRTLHFVRRWGALTRCEAVGIN